MDMDDEAPPDLVDANEVGFEADEGEAAIKVPITIVTGREQKTPVGGWLSGNPAS